MRFLRADGELIGTVGGPEKVAHVSPVGPSEERFALLALKSLELPVRKAKSLLRVALAEQPGAPAGELVRAVLLRYQRSRSA